MEVLLGIKLHLIGYQSATLKGGQRLEIEESSLDIKTEIKTLDNQVLISRLESRLSNPEFWYQDFWYPCDLDSCKSHCSSLHQSTPYFCLQTAPPACCHKQSPFFSDQFRAYPTLWHNKGDPLLCNNPGTPYYLIQSRHPLLSVTIKATFTILSRWGVSHCQCFPSSSKVIP